jgi:porphobilinogen synthase
MTATFPTLRLRRLRQNPSLRELIRETELNLGDLILPLFIKGKSGEKQPIKSMPGHFQIPLSALDKEIEEILQLGIKSVILFGIPELGC